MINTVLGRVDADLLQFVSMHEHCFLDSDVYVLPAREEPPMPNEVSIETLGFIRWNYEACPDNFVLDDDQLTTKELAPLGAVPGAAIVDVTPTGVGRGSDTVRRLAAVSSATEVMIATGCGFYVAATHPGWLQEMTAGQIADYIVDELDSGIGDTGIRPAVIGEIGTGYPLLPRELVVLEAAGQAAVRTGAPVNVHVSPYGREGVGIAQRLTSLGVPAERVILSHMDSNTALDRDYHRELLELGVVIEFDNFGCENYSVQSGRFLRNNSDYERMQHIAELVAEGYGSQLTIGCDVYTKTQLTSFGGLGYDHLHKRIAPTLQEWFGVDASAVDDIVRNTPRRLLDWA